MGSDHGRDRIGCGGAFDALYMHTAVPAGPQQLRDPARIVLVSLVAHGGKGRADLVRFHADNLKAGLAEPIGQMLSERASFEPDLMDRVAEGVQTSNDIWNFGRHRPLKSDLALFVDDADADRSQRHVKCGVVHALFSHRLTIETLRELGLQDCPITHAIGTPRPVLLEMQHQRAELTRSTH